MDRLKIFISGTQKDMQAEREAVQRAIDSVEIAEGIRAETTLSQDQSPKAWIEEQIEACDFYLGVFSHRYGWVIPEETVSATEFEYNLARHGQKPLLIFIRNRRVAEHEEPGFAHQERFLARVSDFSRGFLRREFEDVEDLERQVAGALRESFVKIIRRATPAGAAFPLVAPALIDAYLRALVEQEPYAAWGGENFVERRATEARRPTDATPSSRPLEEILARRRKIVLLGEPGLGKTTSLLRLAWGGARQGLGTGKPSAGTDAAAPEIPVLAELKYYGGEPGLEPLLARSINDALQARGERLGPDLARSADVLASWLTRPDQRFLLLFDGLNEVRPAHHTQVRGALRSLVSSPHRMVVSCRDTDYDQSLEPDLAPVTLSPLGRNDIYHYLTGRLGDRGKQFFYQQGILAEGKVEGFVSNPLMLWLIAKVAESSPGEDLPRNRGRLIRRFVELMPRIRRREGFRPEVPENIVNVLLERLAFEMLESSRVTAELRELAAWALPMTGERLEKALGQAKDWRVLKEDGWFGPVEFLHQLVLEYFAATFLEAQLRAGRTFAEVLGARLFDEAWGEVLVMLAGISDQPGAVVAALGRQVMDWQQGQRALLVMRCWETSSAAADPEATAALVEALLAATRTPENRYVPAQKLRPRVVEALAKVGPPAVARLVAALADESGPARSIAAAALGRIGDPQAVEPLIAALSDGWSRKNAAGALASIGDARAAGPLFALLGDEDEDVRWKAAGALREIGDSRLVEPLVALLDRHTHEELTWLQDVDPDEVDAAEPSELLAGAPDAYWMLSNRRAWGDVELSRLAAYVLAGLTAKDAIEKAVDPLIRALRDPDEDLQYLAAEALGNIGSPRALSHLERLARQEDADSSWGSVATAAREAAKKVKQARRREQRRAK
jgi:HEAT repeat protein